MHYVERLLISFQHLANAPWYPYALAAMGLIVAYSVYKTLRSLPPLVMYPILIGSCVIVFMSWLHDRSEPTFLTPVMDVLAPWFPS